MPHERVFGVKGGEKEELMRKLKRNMFYSTGAMVAWSILGFSFLVFLVIPYLSGALDWYVYGGDNFTYRDTAHSGDINELVIEFLALGNLVGMALFVKLAEFISLDHYDYVILFLNLIILAIAIENYRYIFGVLKSPKYPQFIFWMILNPYIIFNLCSANKEIFGVLFFSWFLRYMFDQNFAKYVFVVLLSFIVRDAYAIAGIIFFMLHRLKVKKIYYLIFMSIIFPFVVPSGQEEFLLEGQDEKSIGISLLLSNIQSYPFGYLITYIPKLFLSAFADLSPLRIFEKSADNIIGNFTTISSFLTLTLCIWLVYKIYFRKFECNAVILNLIYAYTLVAASTLWIHYRYLFPLYPVLVMLVLINGRSTMREYPEYHKMSPNNLKTA